MGNRIETPLNCRRESFNENCLRSVRDEVKERRRSLNEAAEDAGSPFVSMPTIPAVYLVGDQANQPLEKVNSFKSINIYFLINFNLKQFGEMDLDTSEDNSHSLTVPSTSAGYGSFASGSSDRYLTVRRHTVGPGDPAHEQVCIID